MADPRDIALELALADNARLRLELEAADRALARLARINLGGVPPVIAAPAARPPRPKTETPQSDQPTRKPLGARAIMAMPPLPQTQREVDAFFEVKESMSKPVEDAPQAKPTDTVEE